MTVENIHRIGEVLDVVSFLERKQLNIFIIHIITDI